MGFDLVEYDLIVVGSGPAGVSAAIRAGQLDLSVLIISENVLSDTYSEVNSIESVGEEVKILLTELKCDHCLQSTIVGEYSGIRTGNITAKFVSNGKGTYQGYHIDRSNFDKALLKCIGSFPINILYSKAEGFVEYETSIVGINLTNKQSIISKYVIDATGYKKMGGHKLGLQEEFYSTPLFSWSGVLSGIDTSHPIFQDNNAHFLPNEYGWLWLAPLYEGKCCFTGISNTGKPCSLIPAEFSNYQLTGSLRQANRRWSIFRPLVKPGLILCGDAASIMDPAAGDGILNALQSGIKAAETVRDCINAPELEYQFLARYDSWYLANYEKKVRLLRGYYQSHGIDISYS